MLSPVQRSKHDSYISHLRKILRQLGAANRSAANKKVIAEVDNHLRRGLFQSSK